uniref:Uncharacterized protein n=1 Tax=Anguilla anguilla TaxID=7936 RepID=A0A0E9WNW7_ANGAN
MYTGICHRMLLCNKNHNLREITNSIFAVEQRCYNLNQLKNKSHFPQPACKSLKTVMIFVPSKCVVTALPLHSTLGFIEKCTSQMANNTLFV